MHTARTARHVLVAIVGALLLAACGTTDRASFSTDANDTGAAPSTGAPGAGDVKADFDGYVAGVDGGTITVITRDAPDAPIELAFTDTTPVTLWVLVGPTGRTSTDASYDTIQPGAMISGVRTGTTPIKVDVEDIDPACTIAHGTVTAMTASTITVDAVAGAAVLTIDAAVSVIERDRTTGAGRVVDDLASLTAGSTAFARHCAGALDHVEVLR